MEIKKKSRIEKLKRPIIHYLFCFLDPYEIFKYSYISSFILKSIKDTEEFVTFILLAKSLKNKNNKGDFWDIIKKDFLSSFMVLKENQISKAFTNILSYLFNRKYFYNKTFVEIISIYQFFVLNSIEKVLFIKSFLLNHSLQVLSLHINFDCEIILLISDFIENNISLQTLKLQDCEISDDYLLILCKGLSKNHTIKILSFEHNLISSKGLEFFRICLKTNDSIEEINFESNEFILTGGIILSEIIRENKSIIKINANNCKFCDNSLIAIGNALMSNISITEIKLKDHSYSKEAIIKFLILIETNENLTHLELDTRINLSPSDLNELYDCYFNLMQRRNFDILKFLESKEHDENFYEKYLDVLKSKQSIQTLSFENDLSLQLVKSFTHLLYLQTDLYTLSFHNIIIKKSYIKIISCFISKAIRLEEFSISYVNLKLPKLGLLSQGIKRNKSIKKLTLISNSLIGSDVEEIAKLISKNTLIEELDISKNYLGKESCKALAKGLCSNSTLKILKISQMNCPQFSYYTVLFKGIQKNKKIEEIQMRYNYNVKGNQYCLLALIRNKLNIRMLDFGWSSYLFDKSIFKDKTEIFN